MLAFQQESENLLDATLDMDGDAVGEAIEKIHSEYHRRFSTMMRTPSAVYWPLRI